MWSGRSDVFVESGKEYNGFSDVFRVFLFVFYVILEGEEEGRGGNPITDFLRRRVCE